MFPHSQVPNLQLLIPVDMGIVDVGLDSGGDTDLTAMNNLELDQ